MKKKIAMILALSYAIGCNCFEGIEPDGSGGFRVNIDHSRGDLYCRDDDGDGFPGMFECETACWPPDGRYSLTPDDTLWDCDYRESRSFPGNVETCDGINNDCDERIDEGSQEGAAPAIGEESFWQDRDRDGWGAGEPIQTCESRVPWLAYARNGLDCNDVNPEIGPGLPGGCFIDR